MWRILIGSLGAILLGVLLFAARCGVQMAPEVEKMNNALREADWATYRAMLHTAKARILLEAPRGAEFRHLVVNQTPSSETGLAVCGRISGMTEDNPAEFRRFVYVDNTLRVEAPLSATGDPEFRAFNHLHCMHSVYVEPEQKKD